MNVIRLMEQRNMTKYQLSKNSGVPYATLNDICSEKAQIEKCSAETVYKIAKALNVSMEYLICDKIRSKEHDKSDDYVSVPFDVFKSEVCHRVKESGSIRFIVEILKSNDIQMLFDKNCFKESLYLLAMIDYLCRENKLPHYPEYDHLRSYRLSEPLYPNSIIAIAAATHNDAIKKKAFEDAIPEFKRFNIIESEIYNVQ